MQEFLAKEGVTGGLKGGLLPPHNSSAAWGAGLWHYMKKVSAHMRCPTLCSLLQPVCVKVCGLLFPGGGAVYSANQLCLEQTRPEHLSDVLFFPSTYTGV
jgi:hypothetical protein